MRLHVDHLTAYRFDPPVRSVTQSLRVWPTIFAGQQIEEWHVEIDAPGLQRGASFRDGAGDLIETLSAIGEVDRLSIRLTGTVATQDLSGLLKDHREQVPPQAYLRPTRMTRADAALTALAEEAIAGADSGLNRAHALAAAVAERIAYEPGHTASDTTAAEALELGRGVCQDQTHALIAMAHAVGIPARYVTGYLHADAEGRPHEAGHAWAELCVADLGWVGFDPANRCCPNDLYIRLGSGHDSVWAAPIRGVVAGQGDERLEVTLRVTEAAQQQ